ncbi:MAG: hypothetical protein F7C32_03850 [Desulfurococcales archaeon]|nr:hypothetical protein [Desulfurococcales archaeon]
MKNSKNKPRKPANLINLGNAPPGSWAAIIDNQLLAWAQTLPELRQLMSDKGYNRDAYAIIKIPSSCVAVILI